jgi:hypothetical protein
MEGEQFLILHQVNNCCYKTATLTVTAVAKPHMNQLAPASVLTTGGELMEIADIISAKLPMPHGTSQVASSQMRLACWKTQSCILIWSRPLDAETNLSMMM